MKDEFKYAVARPSGRIFAAAALFCLLSLRALAQSISSPIEVTEPLMRYGLGVLSNTAYSPDGKIVALGVADNLLSPLYGFASIHRH